MEQIHFTYNWNKKLECNYFTTLRISPRLKVGEKYLVMFKGSPYKIVKCVHKEAVMMRNLSDNICWLDTGYGREDTIKILKRMYATAILETSQLYICVLETQKDKIQVRELPL